MRKLYLFSALFCLSVLLFISTGCASVTTWQETGVKIYQVHHAEIKKNANGDFELLQKVTSKKKYLPYVSIPTWENDETHTWLYPGNTKPENTLNRMFHLKADHTKKPLIRQKNGTFHIESLSLSTISVNKLNPADITIMRKNPFIAWVSPSGFKHELHIPYAETQGNDDEIILKCYYPLKPAIIIPSEQKHSYEKSMTGAGITILRIAMMPIPIVLDTITLPVQTLALFLLHP